MLRQRWIGHLPIFVGVKYPGEDLVHVGACADEEEDHEEEGLEVEERGL